MTSAGAAFEQRRLLIYANRVNGYDDDQLKLELRAARKDFSADPNAYDRLKYALLLMVPDTSITDYREARSLLTGYLQGGTGATRDAGLRPLARYLLSTVQSREQMTDALTAAHGKNTDLKDKIQKITKVVGDTQGAHGAD